MENANAVVDPAVVSGSEPAPSQEAAPAAAPLTPEQQAAEAESAKAADELKKKEAQNAAWDRIRQQKAEYKARAEIAEKMLFEKQQRESEQAAVDAEPKREQFNSDVEFYQATRIYDRAQITRQLREEQARVQQQAMFQTYEQKVTEAKKELTDFDNVVESSEVKFRPDVQEAILSSPISAHVAYALAKDYDLASRIASMSPTAAAREIGKIEARIEYEKSQKTHTPAKPSGAPAPVKPLAGGGGEAVIDRDKLSDEEWNRARRKKKYNLK